jgi:hypothetical protein
MLPTHLLVTTLLPSLAAAAAGHIHAESIPAVANPGRHQDTHTSPQVSTRSEDVKLELVSFRIDPIS